jgi:hypothetical protein
MKKALTLMIFAGLIVTTACSESRRIKDPSAPLTDGKALPPVLNDDQKTTSTETLPPTTSPDEGNTATNEAPPANPENGHDTKLTVTPSQVTSPQEGKPRIQLKINVPEIGADEADAAPATPPNKSVVDTTPQKKQPGFKVLNADVLNQIDVNKNEGKSVVAGQVVADATAIDRVSKGEALEACQLGQVVGEILKDKLYDMTEFELLGDVPDTVVPVGAIKYTYAADPDHKLVFSCAMTAKAPKLVIVETFKGVLDFEKMP